MVMIWREKIDMATLGFSTHFPERMGNKPTNFVGKIWQGLIDHLGYENSITSSHIGEYVMDANDKALELFNFRKGEFIPKFHTIRADKKNRWKVGDKIHMVVFNRTKNRFQFAPILEVKGIQHILIYNNTGHEIVYVDNRALRRSDKEILAKNDGFDSVEHFFQWFNEDFTGKIIHWTELKY